jgi:two-component system, OmpR family, sensor histidine kinase BaeS
LEKCEEQIDTLASMISEMNRVIDAEKEYDIIKVEEFELNKFLKQIISGLKVQFDKKKIDLKLINQQKVVLKTDRNKLSQCLYNLLTNAYKFTKPNGQVIIGYEEVTDFIEITVKDSGLGINEEDKKHLFEAYFRGAYTFDTEGEGLGLFVVKQNIDAMHGTIEVESEPGKGSKFIIKIPYKQCNDI